MGGKEVGEEDVEEEEMETWVQELTKVPPFHMTGENYKKHRCPKTF